MASRLVISDRVLEVARKLEASGVCAVPATETDWDWSDPIIVLRDRDPLNTPKRMVAIMQQLLPSMKRGGLTFESGTGTICDLAPRCGKAEARSARMPHRSCR